MTSGQFDLCAGKKDPQAPADVATALAALMQRAKRRPLSEKRTLPVTGGRTEPEIASLAWVGFELEVLD